MERACNDELFRAHDEKFQQMDPDTLLIIDNLDIPSAQEPLLEQVAQYPCNFCSLPGIATRSILAWN